MVEYNRSVVYREEWSFNMVETLDCFAADSYMIRNDDVNGYETYDYIELSDYEQCEAVDYALFTIENDLHALFESRVDVEYQVIADMVAHLKEYWNDGDWADSIKVVDRIHDGRYDNELLKYDAFLKANRMLQELHDSTSSNINNMGEELQEIAKVLDIRDEVIKMVANVMVELKQSEYYLNFEAGI